MFNQRVLEYIKRRGEGSESITTQVVVDATGVVGLEIELVSLWEGRDQYRIKELEWRKRTKWTLEDDGYVLLVREDGKKGRDDSYRTTELVFVLYDRDGMWVSRDLMEDEGWEEVGYWATGGLKEVRWEWSKLWTGWYGGKFWVVVRRGNKLWRTAIREERHAGESS